MASSVIYYSTEAQNNEIFLFYIMIKLAKIISSHAMTSSVIYQGCFPLGGIFRAQRNFSLFVSSQAELIEKRQRKIALRAENSA